jgi:uncharacterized protein
MVEFEWDSAKDRINVGKHGMGFALAVRIFEGRTVSWIDERQEYGEQRIRTVGGIEGTLFVTVIHTDRNNIRRIISARPASRKERKIYNDNALLEGAQH